MKSRYILMSVAAAAMTFVSCVKENINDIKFSEVTLNAVTEGSQTKTALTGFADVVWATGDQIAVYDGAAFTDFILSSGAGTASAGFSGTLAEGKTAEAAVYPASAKGTDMTTVKYPAEYAYSEMGVNAPMVASVVEGVLQFKHVGGVVKFDVGNIPPTAAGFVFTANSKITGSFAVTGDAVSTTAGAAESVKITFTPASMKSAVFMVPLPTGTYTGFSVKFVDASDAAIAGTVKEKADYSFTIARKQLLTFPAFVDNTTPASKVLWEGENEYESWNNALQHFAYGGPVPELYEGDILRFHYTATESAGLQLANPNDWTEKYYQNFNVSASNTTLDVNVTADMVAKIKASNGFIVEGSKLTLTKIEQVTSPVAETVLWTGSQTISGFSWFEGYNYNPEYGFNGELPIEYKVGDCLCFYLEALDSGYTAVNICKGYDGGAIVASCGGLTDYGEIKITQDILDQLAGETPRIAINHMTLKKITLKR